MDKLLPCPFCGGSGETVHDSWASRDFWGVACQGKCLVFLDSRCGSEAQAVAAWNRRSPAAPDPAPQAPRCVCCDAPAICTNPKVTTEGGLCWEHSGYITGGPWDDAVRVALEEVAATRLRSLPAPDGADGRVADCEGTHTEDGCGCELCAKGVAS